MEINKITGTENKEELSELKSDISAKMINRGEKKNNENVSIQTTIPAGKKDPENSISSEKLKNDQEKLLSASLNRQKIDIGFLNSLIKATDGR